MVNVDDYEAMLDHCASTTYLIMDISDEDEEALSREIDPDLWVRWRNRLISLTANREDELIFDLVGNLDADMGFGRYVREAAPVDWSAA